MRKSGFLTFFLLCLVVVIGYAINSKIQKSFEEPNDVVKNSKQTGITLTNYKEEGPIIIDDVYPTGWSNIGGKKHKSTQITISAELFIPEDDDYSVSSGFDSLCSVTTIDDIEGQACESHFFLSKGTHQVEIRYIEDRCLDRKYIIDTYGEEAKPLSIYFSIRKKSAKQTIKNYTFYDNPIDIRTFSKPYKKTDLYLHCLPQ